MISLTYTEWKTLERLLISPCDRFELGRYILTGYTPNDVKSLRDKGFNIHTEYVSYLRTDGKETKIGIYHLIDKDKAVKAIEGYQE